MKLHKQQMHLLHSLLKGPLPHNALSREVMALIERLGTVEDHGHNKVTFTVGTEKRAFMRPNDKHMTTEELSEIRHFLLASGVAAPDMATDVSAETKPETLVVVIDHHMARFYRMTDTSRPESLGKTSPHDPHGFRRHLIHRKQANYQGDRIPEDHDFYKAVAAEMKDAPVIVVIGHGTGKSDAAAFLVGYLEKHHSEIAARITGVEVADLSALTDPQIEALAERHLALEENS